MRTTFKDFMSSLGESIDKLADEIEEFADEVKTRVDTQPQTETKPQTPTGSTVKEGEIPKDKNTIFDDLPSHYPIPGGGTLIKAGNVHYLQVDGQRHYLSTKVFNAMLSLRDDWQTVVHDLSRVLNEQDRGQ